MNKTPLCDLHRHAARSSPPQNRCSLLLSFGLAVAGLSLLGSHSAQAASATWNGTTGNWATDSNPPWSTALAPGAASGTTNTDTATFTSSGAGTVTVDATRNIKFIVFNGSSAYTFSGGSLVLTAGGNIQNNASSTAIQNVNSTVLLEGAYIFDSFAPSATNVLNFGGGISQAVTGTLTLQGTNTGTNTISGALADGAGTLSLTKAGTGTWILSGTNTYTGGTTLSGGTLQLGNGSTTGSISASSAITATAATTLAINRSNAVAQGTDFGNLNSTNITLNQLGAGSLTLTGNNTIRTLNVNNATGTVDIGSGNTTITNGGGNALQSTTGGTINATGGGTLTLTQLSATNGGDVGTANGTTLTINAKITGANAFETYNNNNGTGVVVLTNTGNDFTGNVLINSGVVQTPAVGNQSAATSILGSGTTISLGLANISTGTLKYTGTGEVSNRIINLSGGTAGGTIDASGGSGTLELSSNLTAAAGAKTLTLTGTGLGKFSGNLVNSSGTVAITKAGAGTWTLSGANTYTGVTTVNAGTLAFSGSSAMSSGSQLTVNNGGTVALRADADATFTTSAFNPSGGSTTTYDVGAISTGSNNTLTLNSTANWLMGGVIGATMTFNVTGANGDRLQISGGSIAAANNTDTLVFNPTTANLTVASNYTGAAQTGQVLKLDGTSSNNIFSGTMSATTAANLSLTKSNTSTWTLSGTNTYTGKTTVSGGTLQFAKTASLYNSNTANWTAANITAASGATLALNVGGTGEFAATDVNTLLTNISVTSSATTGLQAGAKLGFDTTNAIGGTFTQGNLIANSTGANGGAIGVTKLGTGVLVLNQVNTYTGATAVNAGTLSLGVTKALGATSGVTVASTGMLSLTATNALNTPAAPGSTQVPITLNGGVLLRSGASVISLGSGTTVGAGALTLTSTTSTIDYGTTGVGTLNFNSLSTLSAANTLTVINFFTTQPSLSGTDGTDDRLIFNQDETANLAFITINGVTPTQVSLANGEFELLAAVPEPSTWAVVLVLCGGLGVWYGRRGRIANAC